MDGQDKQDIAIFILSILFIHVGERINSLKRDSFCLRY
jgi:hypothetical protein